MSRREIIWTLCMLVCMLVAVGASSSEEHHSDRDEHSSHEEESHDDHDESHDSHDHDHEHGHGDENNTWLAFGITTGCGLAAMIGYCSIFCMKKEMKALVPASLAFSSGVIVYLSFMNLIPEAIELLGHANEDSSAAMIHFYTLLCIVGGMGLTFAMDLIFSKMGMHSHGNEVPDIALAAVNDDLNPQHERVADTDVEEVVTGEPVTPAEDLSHISFSVAFALIMHHLPEGIATFISLYYELEFGALVAFALSLHDIPAGICIASITYCASGSKMKPFLLCLIAALVYPLGAMIGLVIVEVATDAFIDVFIGVLFGITGGVMLYISWIELLPAAIISARKHNVETLCLCLIFFGFLVMDISSIVLKETGGHSH